MDARTLIPVAHAAMIAAAEVVNEVIERDGVDDAFTITIKLKRRKGKDLVGDMDITVK